MSNFNSYLRIQMEKEKRQKDMERKNIKIVNFKFLNEHKKNNDKFDIVFTNKNSNDKEINFLKDKGTKAKKSILKNKKEMANAETDKKKNNNKNKIVSYDRNMEKDNSMISLYDGTNKQVNIHKYNSIAYIKKRPNDLIKYQNLNRSTITKYSYTSVKTNGRCFSCTDFKNGRNILNNDDLKRTISFYKDMIVTTKKALFQHINPFNIKDFSFKDKEDILNRNTQSNFLNALTNILNKHILSIKLAFFQYMKRRIKMQIHKISMEEYKLLKELKSLGVTNKKELNLLLKDIYYEMKGKN